MFFRQMLGFYNLYWMLRSHGEQKRAWEDAAEARLARLRAEARAAEQARAMLAANPSGQLGHARLDDVEALRRAGLL